MEIQNNKECFVQLWLMLERTRRLLRGQYKRFCIRRVLKLWLGPLATDDFIWEVCCECEQAGWDELPPPKFYPHKHRDFLKALITIRVGKPKLSELDAAYSIAFPNSTSLNIIKNKNPNIWIIKNTQTYKGYIEACYLHEQITEEEYNLLKENLK